ncbi:hypothetical protein GJ744_001240 [Endocarpon pusillum]|uniref:Uncharacterized protein n=1 Tax=Endocarpon pusillum TaxID=364733 RepID=A0A8H7AH87_9EURO|nr:hypothetical protein GJ744_001240 [Endocarpon pusillum]
MRSDTIIQEDNASSHAHRHQVTVYATYDIIRLLWSEKGYITRYAYDSQGYGEGMAAGVRGSAARADTEVD